MFHKVSSVRPLPKHRLSVLFANGEMRQYDVAPLPEKMGCVQGFGERGRAFWNALVRHTTLLNKDKISGI